MGNLVKRGKFPRFFKRRIIFDYYWLIASFGAAVAIGYIRVENETLPLGLVGAVVAAALGFCYFSQQQKLAEMQLFKSLFTEFNKRYDEMNGSLAQIAELGAIGSKERQTLNDYFNLCAEEYLFYREGYIHFEVWQAWCRGMLEYLKQPSIRSVWDEEVETGSYYGLTLDVIEDSGR